MVAKGQLRRFFRVGSTSGDAPNATEKADIRPFGHACARSNIGVRPYRTVHVPMPPLSETLSAPVRDIRDRGFACCGCASAVILGATSGLTRNNALILEFGVATGNTFNKICRSAAHELSTASIGFSAGPKHGRQTRIAHFDLDLYAPTKFARKFTLGHLASVVSGTHGVEGFCGSGCQIGYLNDQLYEALPITSGIVLIHA